MRVRVSCGETFLFDHIVSDFLAGGTFQVAVHTGPEDLPETTAIDRERLDALIVHLVEHGGRIPAIKLVQAAFPGMRLREAKLFIDGYTTHHRRDLEPGDQVAVSLPPQRPRSHCPADEGPPACF